jgi:hypothetical protein
MFMLKKDGTLWHRGNTFMLDKNNKNYNALPVQVGSDTDWVSIHSNSSSANNSDILFIKNDGSAWQYGEQENGENEITPEFVQIISWYNFKAVHAESENSFVDNSGQLFTQIIENTEISNQPRDIYNDDIGPVILPGAIIDAQQNEAFGYAMSDNAVYSWGDTPTLEIYSSDAIRTQEFDARLISLISLNNTTAVLTENGDIYSLGSTLSSGHEYEAYDQLTIIPTDQNWAAIYGEQDILFAVSLEGALYSVGQSFSSYVLGHGAVKEINTLTPLAGLSPFLVGVEDLDNDGVIDLFDLDDDADGLNDSVDEFASDTDNDGVDNQSDSDDDNDGHLDTQDAFPLDPSEWNDNDFDGIGDNQDTDDDNDGILDSADPTPFGEELIIEEVEKKSSGGTISLIMILLLFIQLIYRRKLMCSFISQSK